MKYKTLSELRAGNSGEMMEFLNDAAIKTLEIMPIDRRLKWAKIVMQEAQENFNIAQGGVSYDLLTAIIKDGMEAIE